MTRQEENAEIIRRLQNGEPAATIARDMGVSRDRVRHYHRRGARSAADPGTTDDSGVPFAEGTVGVEDIARIHTLDDLLAFFKVDTERWSVRDFRVNKWEQGSKDPRGRVVITPLYQVRANLIRSLGDQQAALERLKDGILADIAAHAPPAAPEPVSFRRDPDGGVLAVVSIFDPHIGMLAYGKEVGKPYDTDIATADYDQAAEQLLAFASIYPVSKVLFVVGNDLIHVDTTGINSRGGQTTAGTPQDIDSRLERIRTAVRRAVVRAIDKARTLAPVDVLCVPGNHDKASTYWLGEVLNAWYRNDDLVDVRYSAMKRKFYNFHAATFMLTHGEEYKRKRDNLPMIMADECPPEWWVASKDGAREILTGHNHVKLRGGYYPTGDLTESRGIRTRSLPGLTPEDSWHFESGYHHRRAATLLVYGRDGATLGEHEFKL